VLHYVNKRYKPQFMIDLATLTGAIIVALGHEHAGLFANDDKLADRLLEAGLATVKSLAHAAWSGIRQEARFEICGHEKRRGRDGGAITAAQVLLRFVEKTPWLTST